MNRDKIHETVDNCYAAVSEIFERDMKTRIEAIVNSNENGKIEIVDFIAKYTAALNGATMNFTANLLGEVLSELFPDDAPPS